ncbi:MAG: HIT family protein [Patescibacteria group bacterium]
MNTCVFCSIIKKEILARIVYETDEILAFLDHHPNNPGHVLVIPKLHYENIYNTPEEVLHPLISGVKRVSVAVKAGVNAEGVNISVNNEKAAGQLVFHVHFHIIPRFSKDGLGPWPGKRVPEEKMDEVAKHIREKLI